MSSRRRRRSSCGPESGPRCGGVQEALGPVILGVDDDPHIHGFVEAVLGQRSCTVLTTDRGEKALELCRRLAPDVVLLDVTMPGMDGYEVCRRLQREPETACIPVLFVTAHSADQDRARAFAVGAADYLVKPLDPEVLTEKIRAHLVTRERWADLLGVGPAETIQVDRPSTERSTPRDVAALYEGLVERLGADLDLSDQALEALRAGRPDDLYTVARDQLLPTDRVAGSVARYLDLPLVEDIDPRTVALGFLPTPFCVRNAVVPVENADGEPDLVLANPLAGEIRALVESLEARGHGLRTAVTDPERIEALARQVDPDPDVEPSATRAFARAFVAYRAGEQVGVGEIREISRETVFVATDHRLPVGTRLELRFAIREEGSNRLLLVEGEVARLQDAGRWTPAGMDVRLDEIAAEDRALLQEYVADQAIQVVQRSGVSRPRLSGLESLDRFEILGLVGRGGTSEVYKARDRQLDEVVALKVLRRDTDDRDRSRMQREVRLVRRIRSQRVAMAYEFGSAAGRDYVTMEFVPGVPLYRVLREVSPLPEERALEILDDVLDGLGAAHELGIIHRDLKPGNLMVTPEGRTVILDFGLALRADDARVTGEESMVGTPAYMAPEMVSGGELTPAADVYSVGCVLYEMLTGRPPYQGRKVIEVAVKHLNEPAPRVRDSNPNVSPALEGVIYRCMAKNASQRYENAEELRRAIRALHSDAHRRARAGIAPARSVAPALQDLAALVVDDSGPMLEILSASLVAEGCRVEGAATSARALEALVLHEFDVILCNLRTPGGLGEQLYARIRTERPELADRFVFVTGDGAETLGQRFLDEHPALCLTQPFSPRELRAVLRMVRSRGPGAPSPGSDPEPPPGAPATVREVDRSGDPDDVPTAPGAGATETDMPRPDLQRILLVEDEADIRMVASIALEEVGGFEVRECSSGTEALEVAPDYRPDLVLLDVMMPGLDGPATLKALRDRPDLRDVPVFFMTAKIQTHEIEEYRILGAAHVIAKPFDPMTLSDEVKAAWRALA